MTAAQPAETGTLPRTVFTDRANERRWSATRLRQGCCGSAIPRRSSPRASSAPRQGASRPECLAAAQQPPPRQLPQHCSRKRRPPRAYSPHPASNDAVSRLLHHDRLDFIHAVTCGAPQHAPQQSARPPRKPSRRFRRAMVRVAPPSAQPHSAQRAPVETRCTRSHDRRTRSTEVRSPRRSRLRPLRQTNDGRIARRSSPDRATPEPLMVVRPLRRSTEQPRRTPWRSGSSCP